MKAVGRNEPCPCGSGKKFKKCCMPHEASRAAFAEKTFRIGVPLLQRLARFAKDSAGAPLDAIAREAFPFWHGPLSRVQGARVLDYAMFDLRPKHVGRRTVEQFDVEAGPSLDADTRAVLSGWIDAPRRLYRVDGWSGGFTTVTDLLSENAQPIEVFDLEERWHPAAGAPFAIRALPVGDRFACAGEPIGFGGRDAADAADAMRRRHLDFVRTVRIAGIDDFLRAAPTALDEEAARGPARSTIIVPGA
jgi:hypothetical protein